MSLMKEKKAIIIGGMGQIGKQVAEVLEREGYLTICISSKSLPENENNHSTEYYHFDMSCPKEIEKNDTICSNTLDRKIFANKVWKTAGKLKSSSQMKKKEADERK